MDIVKIARKVYLNAMKFATKLVLFLNLVTESGCGFNAMLQDPMLICSFLGIDPVTVPLFGVALTALAISTLLALHQNDDSVAVPVLSGLVFYHFGIVWLFAFNKLAKEVIDSRFPVTGFQRDMMGDTAGSVAGAAFHLAEGIITAWGLVVASVAKDDERLWVKKE